MCRSCSWANEGVPFRDDWPGPFTRHLHYMMSTLETNTSSSHTYSELINHHGEKENRPYMSRANLLI